MKLSSKKFVVVLLTLILLNAIGCTSQTGDVSNTVDAGETEEQASVSEAEPSDAAEEEQTEDLTQLGKDLNIGLVITQRGDNSICDQLFNGVMAAKEKYGFNVDFTECDSVDMPAVMQDYTEAEEYDLIVLLSYHAMDAAIANYEKYPDQKYLIYDVNAPGNPNAMSISFAKNQLGFVAGVFAALMDPVGEVEINGETYTWTPSDKFGAMIGMELTSTVGAITGFYAGVNYINPDAEIQYTTVGSWTDQATAKELALTMYNSGANIIFHNAGGAFLGAVEAAKSLNKFAIGYDANQNNLDPVCMLGSSHKENSAVIMRFFDDFMNGGWEAGKNILNGYNNGGASFTYQDGIVVPAEVQEVMDAVIASIQAGEIDPPSTWDDLETFDLVYSE